MLLKDIQDKENYGGGGNNDANTSFLGHEFICVGYTEKRPNVAITFSLSVFSMLHDSVLHVVFPCYMAVYYMLCSLVWLCNKCCVPLSDFQRESLVSV